MNTANLTIRMEPKIKEEAETLFSELGMSLTTAINIFVRQAISSGGLPFAVRRKRPNRATLEALAEARALAHDPNAKRYDTIEEVMAELNK